MRRSTSLARHDAESRSKWMRRDELSARALMMMYEINPPCNTTSYRSFFLDVSAHHVVQF